MTSFELILPNIPLRMSASNWTKKAHVPLKSENQSNPLLKEMTGRETQHVHPVPGIHRTKTETRNVWITVRGLGETRPSEQQLRACYGSDLPPTTGLCCDDSLR